MPETEVERPISVGELMDVERVLLALKENGKAEAIIGDELEAAGFREDMIDNTYEIAARLVRDARAAEHNPEREAATKKKIELAAFVEKLMKEPTLGQAAVIARMKAEIVSDISKGIVPANVASYSELHNHVDANYYGGAFDDLDYCDEKRVAFWNYCQGEVDKWLKFRATGVDCLDIGAVIDDEVYKGYHGRIYDGVFYILSTNTSHYKDEDRARGLWLLHLGRNEYPSNSLTYLEDKLFQTLKDEGTIK